MDLLAQLVGGSGSVMMAHLAPARRRAVLHFMLITGASTKRCLAVLMSESYLEVAESGEGHGLPLLQHLDVT
jgi:hypothetical protein